MKNYAILFLGLLSFNSDNIYSYKIGFLIVATGKYAAFVDPLIKSARQNFLPQHDRTFFVFTDEGIPQGGDIVKCYHPRVGWPFDTLVRHYASYNYKNILKNMDYIFYCDADTEFAGIIGDEILGELVGAPSLYHINNENPYNIQENSIAFVPKKDRKQYCSGSFYGGKAHEYLKMMDKIIVDIEKDWVRGFFAKHHDESYLNHYLVYSSLTKISPYPVVDCDLHPNLPRIIKQIEKDFVTMRGAKKWISPNKNEQWWLDIFDEASESMLLQFGKADETSRKYVRDYVQKYEYQKVLDVGCGYFMDYYGFRNENPSVRYVGIDIIPYISSLGRVMGADVDCGSSENLPYDNESFDLVYARHFLEYIPSFEITLQEMLRCAKKEVIVIFSEKAKTYPLWDRKTYGIPFVCGYASPVYYIHTNSRINEFLQRSNITFFKWELLEGEKILIIKK